MYQLIQGDCIEVLKTLEAGSVQTCVTSPPYYGLRDYQVEGQIGLEETPEKYVAKLVDVFREVKRVLRDDGTCWINLGDSYVGSANSGGSGPRGDGGIPYRVEGLPPKKGDGMKPKDLMGIPWLVAFALRADGWWLRSDIIWHKPNPMPESVTDRPTKSHEYIFLLSKSATYYYDSEAIAEKSVYPGDTRHLRTDNTNSERFGVSGRKANGNPTGTTRNRRSVWTVATRPYSGAHFATFPPDLIEPCILAGSKPGDTVLDPFNGSGTTGAVALKHGRNYVGIELNAEYIELAHSRITKAQPYLLGVA